MAGDSPLPSASCPGSPGPRPAALLGGTLISALGVCFSGRVTPSTKFKILFKLIIIIFFYFKRYIHFIYQKANEPQVQRGAVPRPRVCSFSAPAPSRLRFSVTTGPDGSVAHPPQPPQLHDVFGQRSTSVPSRRLFRNASSEATLSEEEVCHDSLIVAGSVKGEGRSPHLREPGVCRLHTSADGTLTPPVRPGQWWEARTSRVARACLPGAPRACQTPPPGHAADSPGAAELCLAGRGPSGDTSS